MNGKNEVQFGWGTAVNLSPANADIVRGLVESRISEMSPSSQDYVSLLALRDILLPKSAECDSLKIGIIASSNVLENLVANPTTDLGAITRSNIELLEQLFISRQAGCKMDRSVDQGVDYYDCDKCNFCAQVEH